MATNPTITIKVDSTQAQSSIGAINKVVKQLGADFAKLDTQGKFDVLRKSINEAKKTVEALQKANVTSTKEYQNSLQAVQDLEAAYAELARTNTDLNATFEDIAGEVQPLSARLGEIEDRLYELALAGNQNTQEFKDLTAEAGRYRQAMIQTDLAVDSAALTMNQKLGGALEGVVAGFAVAQGAMGLFGVESEGVQKALLKVQSAMAILQGFQSIKETLPAIKGLKNSIQGLVAPLMAQASATGKATVAQRVLNTVMKANPIFLLIGAITAVVAAYAMFSSASDDAGDSAEEQAKKVDKLNRSYAENIKLIERQVLAQQTKAEIDNTNALIDAKTELLAAEDKLADLQREEPTNLNAQLAQLKEVEKLRGEIVALRITELDTFDAQATAEDKRYDEVQKRLKNLTIPASDEEGYQEAINKYDELIAEREKLFDLSLTRADRRDLLYRELILAGEEFAVESGNRIADFEQKIRDESLASVKKLTEEERRLFWELNTDKRLVIEDTYQKEVKEAQDAFDRSKELGRLTVEERRQAENDYNDSLIQAAKKRDRDLLALEKQNAEKLLNERKSNIIKIETEINHLKRKLLNSQGLEAIAQLIILHEKEKELLRLQMEFELENTELTEEEKLKIKSEYELKIAQLEKDFRDRSLKSSDENIKKQTKSFKELFKEVGETWTEDWAIILSRISDFTVQIGSQITDLLGQLFSQLNNQTMFSLEEDTRLRNEALSDELANRLISQEDYDRKVALLENQKLQKERALKKKQFNQDKALRISSSIMLGAQAVMAALTMPPPASYVMAAINAGLAAAQLGIIASQKFTAARGGVVPGSGPSTIDSVDALLAPGEMVINSNSASMFPTLLSEINKIGGGVPLAPEPLQNLTPASNGNIYERGESVVTAVVVETQMSGVQNRVRRMENSSSF